MGIYICMCDKRLKRNAKCKNLILNMNDMSKNDITTRKPLGKQPLFRAFNNMQKVSPPSYVMN